MILFAFLAFSNFQSPGISRTSLIMCQLQLVNGWNEYRQHTSAEHGDDPTPHSEGGLEDPANPSVNEWMDLLMF